MNSVEVYDLTKTYGSNVKAVNGVSFDVEKGSLFAFLGTNGAGKTTTINILTTLIKKTSGRVIVDGYELGKNDDKIRKSIGAVFQNGVLDGLLSVRENMRVRGSMYGLNAAAITQRIDEVARITDCVDFLDQRYEKLSGGQKRRADIARALINSPEILFLDEPTTGLDPANRVSIWNTVSEMQKELSMTVFLTTHYMEEASNADKIAIIQNGEIIASGTPNELKEAYTYDMIKIYEPDRHVLNYLKNAGGVEYEYDSDKEIVIIKIRDPQHAVAVLNDLKPYIRSFEAIHGNMDDVFINITNAENELAKSDERTAGKEKLKKLIKRK
ncbi:MAG: ATP-binding cassette domain-containing protein [Clostridiales bacterium]|jgi:multidrug/hemolysin transport system ATP-binding protein|nr:ATP-binding cassette domain-containing protein [Clostridiales bacterium]